MIWHANLHSCCLLAGREELLGDQSLGAIFVGNLRYVRGE
jgi:hypothetical protein